MSSFLLLVIPGLSAASDAASPGTGNGEQLRVIANVRQAAKSLTLHTLKDVDAYHQAVGAAKTEALTRLHAMLHERRRLILEFMEYDPKQVLQMTLPEQLRTKLPEELEGMVERSETLHGALDVLVEDDFAARRAQYRHQLRTTTGEHVQLHFAKAAPSLLTGTQFTVQGVRLENRLAVDTSYAENFQITAAAAPTPTVKTVGVILFNFQSDTRQPYSTETARSLIFQQAGGVRAYFEEASFSKLTLQGKSNVDGDVFGWYTIPASNATCDYNLWGTQARDAASAAGVDLNGYTNLIYMFPGTGACNWSGLAFVGGSHAWINFWPHAGVVAHELGHNLGLRHANLLACTDASGQPVAISDTCTEYEYGDYYDVMGDADSFDHFNSAHKLRVGWFEPSNVLEVRQNGLYAIAPLETSTNGIQTLLVPRTIEPNGVISEYYYLEFRQPYGLYFDNYVPSSAVVNGVLIHLSKPSNQRDSTRLIRPIPSYSALPVGATFVDPIKQIRITTRSVSSSGASVDVELGPITCRPTSPTVAISPSAQWGYPGTSLTYFITLTNTNTLLCGTSTFTITFHPQAGWTLNPDMLTADLAPGASQTLLAHATSPLEAPSDFYAIAGEVTDSVQAGQSTGISLGYNVLPATDSDLVVTVKRPLHDFIFQPKTLSVGYAAKAIDPDGVRQIDLFVDGSLKKTCTPTTKRFPKQKTCSMRLQRYELTRGSHTLTAIATDASTESRTASNSITIINP